MDEKGVGSKGEAARRRILDATIGLIRRKGFEATRIDEICAAAGLTKGGFFHHFSGKEDLGVAVARHWGQVTGSLFAAAPYHDRADPLDRVVAYLEFRRALLTGGTDEFTCLAGTLSQELHQTSPAIRDAAADAIFDHAATLVDDIAAAKAARCPHAEWSPESLAQFTQAVLQGAFVLAKARGGADTARRMVDHLLRYVDLLFSQENIEGESDGTDHLSEFQRKLP